MPLRVGLIGLEGHQGVILNGIVKHEDSSLVAISTEGRPRLKHAAVTKETRFYDDYREMIREVDLDIVGICNVNNQHADAIELCARASINIICEKPLTTTLDDLDRVRRSVEEAGIHFTTLMTMRFEPAYKLMREIVLSGEIGDPACITAQKSYRLGDRPEWMKNRETFGGTIPYIGIHMLDLIYWTSGRRFVQGMAYHSNVCHPEVGDMEDNAGILLRLDNGGNATIRLDYLRPMSAPSHGDDRLRIAGGMGVIEATNNGRSVSLITAERGIEQLEIPEADDLYLDFVRCIEEYSEPRTSFLESYEMTRIALKLRESADQCERVDLE